MIIRQLNEINTSAVRNQDLINFLEEIVLSKTEEEIEKKEKELLETKRTLEKSKNDLKENRNKLIDLTRETSRFQLIGNILSMVEILKREGFVYGETKTKILNLLGKLKGKTFSQLKAIEEQLKIHMPDDFIRKIII